MELLRDAHPIREKVTSFLADGKRVRLVLVPPGSNCLERFMIHASHDVDVQVRDALEEMHRRNIPGIHVEEVAFSEDTCHRMRTEPL